MRFHSPLWIVFLLGHWLSCGFIAWHLLASVNFGYATAYEWLDIDQHIATYGPQNRNRQDFESTKKSQHIALFAQINKAVHAAPDRLYTIEFRPAQGHSQTLLTTPEAVHLTDVAMLIDKVYLLGWLSLVASIISVIPLWLIRSRLPRPSRVFASVTGSVALLLVIVFIIGPKNVFYYLHTWAFPPEHPWFFYYQDSLMTTLMKAPDLFGFIAAILLSLWLLLWATSLLLIIRLWPKPPH